MRIRIDILKAISFNTDINNTQLPTHRPTRIEEMARLGAKEADGHGRGKGRRIDGTAIAIHPAWHIHGNNRRGGPPDSGKKTRHVIFQMARESGAKPCIDHQLDTGNLCLFQRENGPVPAIAHIGRIPLQQNRINQRDQINLPASRVQMPGNDIAIATVIARTAEDKTAPARPAIHDQPRTSPARRLHQHGSGHPALHGQSVRLIHLGNAEQLGGVSHWAISLERSGRMVASGQIFSNAAAAFRTARSPCIGPTICNPMGKPSDVNPQGMEQAGCCVRLKG